MTRATDIAVFLLILAMCGCSSIERPKKDDVEENLTELVALAYWPVNLDILLCEDLKIEGGDFRLTTYANFDGAFKILDDRSISSLRVNYSVPVSWEVHEEPKGDSPDFKVRVVLYSSPALSAREFQEVSVFTRKIKQTDFFSIVFPCPD